MKMTKHIEKNYEENKAAYLCFMVTCKDEEEMDIVRDIFEGHAKYFFGDDSLSFDKCYDGDEVMNYDIIGFAYDKDKVDFQTNAMKEIWRRTKETYKNMKKQGLLK